MVGESSTNYQVNINQASQGIQEVNENVGQSSIVAAGNISQGSNSVQSSAGDLARMATELNTIVNSFKV